MKNKIVKISIIAIILILIIGVYILKSKDNEKLNNNELNNEIINIEKTQEEIDFSTTIVDGDLNIERLTSYGVPVIIDFGADYCQPCKDFEPTLLELKKQYGNDIIIKLVDIQQYPEIATQYEIVTIPTQLFYNNDGLPYTPLSDMTNTNIEYKKDENGTILYTKHNAGSSLNKMKIFLYEMGLNNEDEIKSILGYTQSTTNKITIEK